MSDNRGSDGEEEEEEEIMEDGEENISDDDSEQQSVGFDKGASEKTVRRLLRASTAAVHDETVRAKQSRPNTTTGGVLVQTALVSNLPTSTFIFTWTLTKAAIILK